MILQAKDPQKQGLFYKYKRKIHPLAAACFCLLLFGPTLQGQFFYGLTQDFGKNRVQYRDFDWVFYRYEKFDIYFYRGNEELAAQVSRMTNESLPEVERFLDGPLDERLQILVFNTLTDLKQSNVNSSEDADYNQQGVTRIAGRRMFVYFNGDYRELHRHLRMGLAEVVLSNLAYGSFTQSITNSALLNLPAWYTEGLISYVGERWSPEVDREVRNGFYSGRFKRINSLTQEDARYAGHSFWYYLSQVYGDKVIRNILYMSIVNRDIESGFLYILGQDLKSITQGWRGYFEKRYQLKDLAAYYEEADPLIKARKNRRITRMAISRDGRYLAYVDQRFSRYKLYLYDFETGKRKKIYRGGYRIAQNTDRSYPIMAWHPNNRILAFFTEEQGVNWLNFYNLEDGNLEEKKFFRFEKVLSFEYSSDGRQFLLSGTNGGQSDIYLYTILNTKFERITNDAYDDLQPSFFDNDRRVAWSSNRPVDSLYPNPEVLRLPQSHNDLFAAELRPLNQDSLAIWRLTRTPNIHEEQVEAYEPGYLSFLSNRSGSLNQHWIQIDSSVAYVDTITHYQYEFNEYQAHNDPANVIDQVFAPRRDKRYDLIQFDRRYGIYARDYLRPGGLPLKAVERNYPAKQAQEADNGPRRARAEAAAPLFYPGVSRRQLPIDITNYRFGPLDQERPKPNPESRDTLEEAKPEWQSFEAPGNLPELMTTETEEEQALEIPPKRNYFLSFYQDEFNVRFDNMFDNRQYQPFTGVISGNLLNQGFNMNFKVGVMDLMHDYRLVAGMRTTFQPLAGTSLTPNAEFVFALGDYKKRLDKIYTYQRRSQVQFLAANNYQRFITNEVEAKTIWPFSPVASLRGSLGYRIDENIGLARDFTRLDEPLGYTDYAIARLAYVYDNTRKIGLNLYAGLRYKLFTEYYRNLTISNSGLHTAGLDARHYLIIHRNMIWANRLAAGTSFGPEKLIYIMGGVDNDFSPNNDPSTPIARENNYIFQTLVTNMRGFFQNARNGNSFAVINSEWRWPFVSYLANRPLRNDFINNLMLVGFADVGTAWNGPSPYARENAINTREIPLGTDGLITLDSQKEPIIFGTGFGLRSRLFGYYVRADWAWGIEDGIVLPNVFYLSLSTDF